MLTGTSNHSCWSLSRLDDCWSWGVKNLPQQRWCTSAPRSNRNFTIIGSSFTIAMCNTFSPTCMQLHATQAVQYCIQYSIPYSTQTQSHVVCVHSPIKKLHRFYSSTITKPRSWDRLVLIAIALWTGTLVMASGDAHIARSLIWRNIIRRCFLLCIN